MSSECVCSLQQWVLLSTLTTALIWLFASVARSVSENQLTQSGEQALLDIYSRSASFFCTRLWPCPSVRGGCESAVALLVPACLSPLLELLFIPFDKLTLI